MRCSDCGTSYRRGLCPNCHEEAYILAHQTDDYACTFSPEFVERAAQQERDARAAIRSAGPQS
jgi:hypothetical protein